MDKIFKASRAHLPFYWFFFAPPAIFIIATFLTLAIFSQLDDQSIVYILVPGFVFLCLIISFAANRWLRSNSYMTITAEGTLRFHGFMRIVWEIPISAIEAMDEKPGSYIPITGRTKIFIRTEFAIKSNNQYYTSPIRLRDWESFVRHLKTLNPNIVLQNLAPTYFTDFGYQTVISDANLYTSGNMLMRYMWWGLGAALIVFCLYVISVVRG